jgi:hypothetical protein
LFDRWKGGRVQVRALPLALLQTKALAARDDEQVANLAGVLHGNNEAFCHRALAHEEDAVLFATQQELGQFTIKSWIEEAAKSRERGRILVVSIDALLSRTRLRRKKSMQWRG